MTTRSAPEVTIVVRRPGTQKKGTPGGEASRFDVSHLVFGVKFTDTEKGADKLSFSVNNFDYSLFDDPIFAHGNIIEFSFGYAEIRSPMREFTITKMTGGAVLSVEANGKAYVMMTERRTRTFSYMTYSEIARQIAKEYGFEGQYVFVEDTTEVIPVYAQGGITDYQVLMDMGRRLGFVQWVDYRGFHWRPRDLKQAPRRALVYYTAPGRGDILTPPKVENDITAKPAAVTAKGIDPKTKEPIDATADNDTTKRDGLAPVLLLTKTGGVVGWQAPNPVGSSAVVATSEKSQEAAQTAVNGAYTKMQLSSATLTFDIVGDPMIEAKTIITLSGFSQALAGNYYITEAAHNLSGDYKTSIKCRRDGTSSASAAPGKDADKTSQASVNKTKADPDVGGYTADDYYLPVSKTGDVGVTFVRKDLVSR